MKFLYRIKYNSMCYTAIDFYIHLYTRKKTEPFQI
jgi:hypothetical protein